MTEQERKTMLIIADTIQGEINRMCVTKELSELETIACYALSNVRRLRDMRYADFSDTTTNNDDLLVVKMKPDLIPIEVLHKIRQEIADIPTIIKGIGYFNQREVHSYQIDVLKVIDSKIKEYTV